MKKYKHKYYKETWDIIKDHICQHKITCEKCGKWEESQQKIDDHWLSIHKMARIDWNKDLKTKTKK